MQHASLLAPLLPFLVSGFFGMLLPVPARGQTPVEAADAASRPDHSILLGIGESTDLGFWMRLGERTDLGLETGIRFSDTDGSEAWGLSLTSSLKRYLGEDLSGSIAPYVLFGLFASRADTETMSIGGGAVEASNEAYGALFGLGLDWYPTRRVSVGGHVGLDAALTRREAGTVGASGEADGFRVGTRSSGVRVQLYF